jgi:chitinase
MLCLSCCYAQRNSPTGKSRPLAIIAYYAGRPTMIDSFDLSKLTHIIFSFCHLQGERMEVSNARDSATIHELISLKSKNPSLKVLLSIGGWGGCRTCSEVFSTKHGRKKFTRSVKELIEYFGADGIDIDWEYPVIAGFPDHRYAPSDKDNFTDLIKRLRNKLGNSKEISFAAGGFTQFLQSSIDWKNVMPRVNRVNLMTYDLIGGYSTVTGHHTALYSTQSQVESSDHAIHYLDSIGVPRNKLVLGAAFYARVFENVENVNNGLYQPGKFRRGISYRNFSTDLAKDSGYVYHWDSTAQAPYLYQPDKKLFVTFDDSTSMRIKTQYVIDKKLQGIMFWQLADDSFSSGLLDIIYAIKQKNFQ